MDTLRLFLALVAKLNLECSHFDIKNAFTESQISDQLFLSPPKGVKVQQGAVLKILKSLYGLKQAGLNWHQLLRKELMAWGFIQSLADPCLFTHQSRSIWLLVYVDDIIAASKIHEDINWFGETLRSRFTTRNLGEIEKVLGVRVIRDRKKRSITLDQEEYLDRTLNRFNITHGQKDGKKVPIQPLDYEYLRPAIEQDELIDVKEYQQIIGSLMHAMVLTRPDIAFALGRLAQFMAKPNVHHGRMLKNLMRYIRSTIGFKLRFAPGGAHKKSFAVYIDTDWAGNRSDRKSISRRVAKFYGYLIS
jgi:hypothetical protein